MLSCFLLISILRIIFNAGLINLSGSGKIKEIIKTYNSYSNILFIFKMNFYNVATSVTF